MDTPLPVTVWAFQPLLDRVRRDVTAKRDAVGRQIWTNTPLTDERFAAHLDGSGPARGVCPINANDNRTRMALLDFDDHGAHLSWPAMSDVVQRVCDALEFGWGMQPILWRSGGGHGVHLMLLWEDKQDAYSVRAMLTQALVACGLADGNGGVANDECEIFPKQSSVPLGGYGNQFILPGTRASTPLALGVLAEEDVLW